MERKGTKVGNQVPTSGDSKSVECERSHRLLSARLDGECTEDELDALDRHLTACLRCRAYEAGLAYVHRLVRVRPAEVVPDLTAAILERWTPARHQRSSSSSTAP